MGNKVKLSVAMKSGAVGRVMHDADCGAIGGDFIEVTAKEALEKYGVIKYCRRCSSKLMSKKED